jgi:hypothetical protein
MGIAVPMGTVVERVTGEFQTTGIAAGTGWVITMGAVGIIGTI